MEAYSSQGGADAASVLKVAERRDSPIPVCPSRAAGTGAENLGATRCCLRCAAWRCSELSWATARILWAWCEAGRWRPCRERRPSTFTKGIQDVEEDKLLWPGRLPWVHHPDGMRCHHCSHDDSWVVAEGWMLEDNAQMTGARCRRVRPALSRYC
jgi:hypothetical protein